VCVWDALDSENIQEEKYIKTSNEVLTLDVWGHFLAIGSTSILLVDMRGKEPRRIMVIDMKEGEEESLLV